MVIKLARRLLGRFFPSLAKPKEPISSPVDRLSRFATRDAGPLMEIVEARPVVPVQPEPATAVANGDATATAKDIISQGLELRSAGKLDEAERVFALGMEKFPGEPWLATHHASIALARRDWREAIDRFARAREAFPNFAGGFVNGGVALCEAGRLEDADAVLDEARRRFPANVWAYHHYAVVACRRRDWQEAVRRFDELRAKFPGHAAAYVQAGLALRETGRLDDAEAMLDEAMTRFPTNPWAAIHYASIASLRRDRAEAVKRFEQVRMRFPDFPGGYVSGGIALADAGRLAEADAVLAEATRRFPSNLWAFHHFAENAVRRREFVGAVERWTNVLTLFPDHPGGYVGAAGALSRIGRRDEAESLLLKAKQKFPDNERVAGEHARFLTARSDAP